MSVVPEKYKVKIGGNYYIDCKNLIVQDGQPLFTLGRRDDGHLGIDMDIYNNNGTKVATIRGGNIVQGNVDEYELHKNVQHYWIVEKESGRVICDIKQKINAETDCELELSVDLFTKAGFHLVASPTHTNWGRSHIQGCTFQGAANAAIVIP